MAATAHRLSAQAAVRIEHVRGRNTVTELRCETPLVLRAARAPYPAAAAHLTQVSTAAGPLAGDHLRLRVEVAEKASSLLRSTGATIVQPGPDHAPSSNVVSLRADAGSTLDYQPQPTVVVANAIHEQVLELDYDRASVLTKETVVLGRHNQPPGSCVLRTRVRTGGVTVLTSSVALGPLAPVGWDAITGTAGYRCLISGLTTRPLTPRTRIVGASLGAVHALDCGLRSISVLAADATSAHASWCDLVGATTRA